MLDRSLRARSVIALGAAVAALTIAVPVATAVPGTVFVPRTQTAPRSGERLSGANRSWPSLRHTTPHLGEGLTAADRSWLAPTASVRPVASPPNGFDWGDAGIGAGTAAAAILVVGGSVVALRRRVLPAQ